MSKLSSRHRAYKSFFSYLRVQIGNRFSAIQEDSGSEFLCTHWLQTSDYIMGELYENSANAIDVCDCSSDLLWWFSLKTSLHWLFFEKSSFFGQDNHPFCSFWLRDMNVLNIFFWNKTCFYRNRKCKNMFLFRFFT